jgi:hypothetical protein
MRSPYASRGHVAAGDGRLVSPRAAQALAPRAEITESTENDDDRPGGTTTAFNAENAEDAETTTAGKGVTAGLAVAVPLKCAVLGVP